MRPDEFLEIVSDSDEQQSPFRLGTIPSDYAGGMPRVQFDYETTAGNRTYVCLNGYTPAAGDRVLCARVGKGWVILDKLNTFT